MDHMNHKSALTNQDKGTLPTVVGRPSRWHTVVEEYFANTDEKIGGNSSGATMNLAGQAEQIATG